MGLNESKMCSCSSFQKEETKEITNQPNLQFFNEEEPKFSEIAEPKVKSNDPLDFKSSSIFSSRLKDYAKRHGNLFTRIAAHKQEHILSDIDQLNDNQLNDYFESLYDIDFELMDMMYNHLILKPEPEGKEKEKITPVKNITKLKNISSDEYYQYRDLGLEMIAQGKLGVLILSGGQGSRLGFEHAKGMYRIGMPSNKSLFHYFAERINKVVQLAKEYATNKNLMKISQYPIHYFVMTSEMNDKEIKEFFKEYKFFGIPQENITFFPQQSLPALDLYGKIIMEGPNKVFMAPNGNGGLYGALLRLGIIRKMYHIAKKKIKYYDANIKEAVTPLENNGYKFELYIMDGYLLCDGDKFGLLEARRNEEFAPVKNAPGSSDDSPDTARELMSKLYQKWLISKGVKFSKEASGHPDNCCEISPIIAYDYEDLNAEKIKHLLKDMMIVDLPLHIEEIN